MEDLAKGLAEAFTVVILIFPYLISLLYSSLLNINRAIRQQL